MTTYVNAANKAQFDAFLANRTGPAKKVTWVADATTLATVTGSGHTVVFLCGYHTRLDADVIEAQIASLVDSGKATIRQESAEPG